MSSSKISSKVKAFFVILLCILLAALVSTLSFVPVAMVLNSNSSDMNEIFDDSSIELSAYNVSEISTLYANDNKTVLANFYSENRLITSFDNTSSWMHIAIIDHEDRRFYEHNGVDIVGLFRAFVSTYLTSNGTQGGSGITQQYIKNILINEKLQNNDPIGAYYAQAQTLYRKLKEAIQAIELEKIMTKDEILQGYLNLAAFGTNLYGVETAARRYFGKSAKNLTLIEAATIAGITKSPAMYDPLYYPENCEEQRNIVLGQMLAYGDITEEQYEEAVSTPIEDTLNPTETPIGCQTAAADKYGNAAFFCDYIINVILNDEVFGETIEARRKLLYNGGLKIYSTIDLDLQKKAWETSSSIIPPDDESGVANAIVSVEPGTGAIKAMVQNRYYDPVDNDDPGYTAINYSTDEVHGGSRGFQTGSTFKTYIITDWVKTGNSLKTYINGSPRVFKPTEFGQCSLSIQEWTPVNISSSENYGQTVYQATQMSSNIPFVEMGTKNGLCSILSTAKKMGFKGAIAGQEDIESEQYYYPSTLLGTINTSPLSMAEGYATVASGGIHCDSIAINKITRNNEEIPVPEANCQRVLSEVVANAVADVLKSVIDNGIGSPFRVEDHTCGLKTGTTDDNYHLWTVGFCKQLSTAVWSGYPNYNEKLQYLTIGSLGYRYNWLSLDLPGPIWGDYMNKAMENYTDIPFEEVAEEFLVSGTWGKFPSPTPSPTKTKSPTATATDEPSPSPSPSPSESTDTETPA